MAPARRGADNLRDDMADTDDLHTILGKFGGPREQAIAAAYALVSVYDSKVDDAELGRFVEIAMESGFTRRPAELSSGMTELVAALDADRDKGDPVAFSAIEAVKGDEAAVQAVRKSAKEAVLADQRVDVRERLVLREIAERLGLDPNTI